MKALLFISSTKKLCDNVFSAPGPSLLTTTFSLCRNQDLRLPSRTSKHVELLRNYKTQSPTRFECSCHLFEKDRILAKVLFSERGNWRNLDSIASKSITHKFTFILSLEKNIMVDLYLLSLRTFIFFFKPSFSHCVTVVLSFPTAVLCCLAANHNCAVIEFHGSFVMVSTRHLKAEQESELHYIYSSRSVI